MMYRGPPPYKSRLLSGILMASTFVSLVWWYNAIILTVPAEGFGTVEECGFFYPPHAHYFGGDGFVDLYCVTLPGVPFCKNATLLNNDTTCSCLEKSLDDELNANATLTLFEVSVGSEYCTPRRKARVYSSRYPQYVLVVGTAIATCYNLYMRMVSTGTTSRRPSFLVVFLASVLPLLSLVLAIRDFRDSDELGELALATTECTVDCRPELARTIDALYTENIVNMGAALIASYEAVYLFFIFSWSNFRDNPNATGPLEREAWRWHVLDCGSGVGYVTVAFAHLGAFDRAFSRFVFYRGWPHLSILLRGTNGCIALVFAMGLRQCCRPGSPASQFSWLRASFNVATNMIISPLLFGMALLSSGWLAAASVAVAEASAFFSILSDYVNVED